MVRKRGVRCGMIGLMVGFIVISGKLKNDNPGDILVEAIRGLHFYATKIALSTLPFLQICIVQSPQNV